ncbi:DUF58 domain-containing protein [Acidisphaera sp. L21]|uniref:DUF58 domain-containing protein n=1 Tax=Acidisphaera sp. L21 TaxID=1641851 RepID=UPI00131EB130|nr:DUF58 domain-containing protein [Acidisphaera sp. L21]
MKPTPARSGQAVLRAEALGSALPPLLVAAERVASTVAQGVHGRRRVGQGDSFWQFRPYQAGDAPGRIDWRQSAKSPRTYVRETEWEAAQTVHLWRDGSASMHWRSGAAMPEKVERAELLLLAAASLLLRGGERVRLLGQRTGGSMTAIAAALATDGPGSGVPPVSALPAHSRLVLIGDFLQPLDDIRHVIAQMAAIPVRGHLLQILDPAEALLPYSGRVRFRGVEADGDMLVPQVEGIRDAYAEALAAQQAGLAALCRAAGWGFATHRTDAPPASALLSLYTALAGIV